MPSPITVVTDAMITSSRTDINQSEVLAPGKERGRVQARSLLCYWAARELGISMAELSRRLKISASAVTLSVKRGEKIVQKSGYKLI